MCYISSIFLYFHWDFDNRHYFYEKETFNGFFKSSQYFGWTQIKWWYFGWTWKQCALRVSYVVFSFISSIDLFSSCKKWLSYLSHAISPYLHRKWINWTSAFYLSFCCTVSPRILNIWTYEPLWLYEYGCFNYLYLSFKFHAFSYVTLYRMVFASILTISRYIILRCQCGAAIFCFGKISRGIVSVSKLWVIRLYIVVSLI